MFKKLDRTYDDQERLKLAGEMQELIDAQITQIDAFESMDSHYLTSTRTLAPKKHSERGEWTLWSMNDTAKSSTPSDTANQVDK